MRRLPTVAALCLAGTLLAAGSGLRVATWNLQNYLLQNRFPEGRFRPDYPMPEAQKQRIRQLLLETRPDVLFLQEIGSAAFLCELQLDLAAGGLDYPHARFAGLPDSRSGLAVLSRLPLDEVVFHDRPDLRRSLQEVALRHAGRRLRFFHVHLKSRYTSDPLDPDSRAARSAEIRDLTAFLDLRLRAEPAAALVLLGDFNTPFDDPLLDPLRAAWSPVPAADTSGATWTYRHVRSGTRERLDGFWVPRRRPAPLAQPARLLPADLEPPAPSDHRMVLGEMGPMGLRGNGTDGT